MKRRTPPYFGGHDIPAPLDGEDADIRREAEKVVGPGGAIAHPRRSFGMLNVQVTLSEVVDLTDVSASQLPLQTTAQEMTGDWDGYQVRVG